MPEYSVDEFVAKNAQRQEADAPFQLENPHLLEINLEGLVWAKLGSMIGYVGNVKFTRQGALQQGLGKFLKKAVSGEGTKLMKMEGQGRVYLADKGKKIQVLRMEGETISVNGNDLLAFEQGIEWDITMMKRIAGMMAGGLFNVELRGRGMVAITTHYDPLVLRVTPEQPVLTDPNATVAWSGNLSPDIQTDVSFKTFLGRGSGESFQLRFEGDGWVVLQPFEEIYMQASQ
jgi:uncharacterized protein (AIM24 family)